MKNKLLPYPMCGSEDIDAFRYSTSFFRVICCDCELETGNYFTKQEAIDAWNTRTSKDKE